MEPLNLSSQFMLAKLIHDFEECSEARKIDIYSLENIYTRIDVLHQRIQEGERVDPAILRKLQNLSLKVEHTLPKSERDKTLNELAEHIFHSNKELEQDILRLEALVLKAPPPPPKAEAPIPGEIENALALLQIIPHLSSKDKQALNEFQEQMKCLGYQLANLNLPYSKDLKDFCLHLITDAMHSTKETREADIVEAKILIGELIYLHESGNFTAISNIWNQSGQRFNKPGILSMGIGTEYRRCLREAFSDLKKNFFSYGSYRFAEHFSHFLASILITNNGYLNLAIIPWVVDSILKLHKEEEHLGYKERSITILQKLLESQNLQNILKSIKLPLSPDSPSNQLIRTSLKLNPDSLLNDSHARKVALAALLTNRRQMEMNCASAAFAFRTLSTHPEQCLMDFSEMLQKGYLTRTIREKEVQFPIILKLYDIFANYSPVVLNEESGLYNFEKMKLEEDYSELVNRVCSIFGVTNEDGIETVFNKAIHSYILENGLENPKKINLNFREIIWHIVQTIYPKKSIEEQLNRLHLATYEAQSLFQNPLISSWESNLYSISHEIIQLHQKKLQGVFRKVSISMIESSNPKITKKIINEFCKNLGENSAYLYNLDVQVGDKEFIGALVLYSKNGEKNSTKWTHIQNSNHFKSLLISILNELEKKHTDKKSKEVLTQLKELINSKNFINKMILNMKEKKQQQLKNPAKLDKSIRVPWRIRTSVHMNNIHKGYWNEELATILLRGGPPSVFASRLFDKAKEIRAKAQNLKAKGFSLDLLPIRFYLDTSHHGFNLRMGDPVLVKGIERHENAQEWLKSIKKTGKEIANSSISLLFPLKFLKSISKHFKLDEGKLKNGLIQAIKKYKEDKNINEVSHRQFLKILLSFLKDHVPVSQHEEYSIINALLKHLSPDISKKLLDHCTILFADSNYDSSGNNVLYGIYVNPFNEQLEYIKFAGKFSVLDQEMWNKRDYEIGIPKVLKSELSEVAQQRSP